MAGVSPFLKAAFVCLLLSAKVSSDDLLNSLRFTRDALLGFSRVVRSSTSDSEEAYSRSSKEEKQAEQGNSFRSSNKKLQIENEIEKATENAKAMESRRPRPRTRDLVRLFTKAVNSKSYSYARDILGKLVYQVQVMTTRSSKRRKRSPKNAGARFLKRLLENIGSEKIDSFMAVNGSVSLMFVVDDTGSMSDEIEQVKRIAITVVNYRRKAPVEFILSPFNDPMTGIVDNFPFYVTSIDCSQPFFFSFFLRSLNEGKERRVLLASLAPHPRTPCLALLARFARHLFRDFLRLKIERL